MLEHEDKDDGFFFFFKFCDILKCGNFFRKRFAKWSRIHTRKKIPNSLVKKKMAIIYLFLNKEKTLEEEEAKSEA
jgi:hypothetical protein